MRPGFRFGIAKETDIKKVFTKTSNYRLTIDKRRIYGLLFEGSVRELAS